MNRLKFNLKFVSITLFLALFFISTVGIHQVSAKTLIKCAIVAPKGSTWMNILEQWDRDLRKKTKGDLGFKFYSSGSMGDEKTVLRKMRSGQLDAAGLTGLGLGMVVPEIRLLELPFMYDSIQEVDYVRANLNSFYDKEFDKKGFVNIAWAETGFVYMFTNKPIRGVNDLKGSKMWMWEGDKMVEEVFKILDFTPTPLSLTDVLTSLQTKLIDGVYAPPVAAISLQWTTKVKYMLDLKMANSTGAILLSKDTWDKLSPDNRNALEETSKIYSQKLINSIRTDNEKAKNSIKASGITFTTASPAEVQKMKDMSFKAAEKLIGKLYSRDMLQKAKNLKKQAN